MKKLIKQNEILRIILICISLVLFSGCSVVHDMSDISSSDTLHDGGISSQYTVQDNPEHTLDNTVAKSLNIPEVPSVSNTGWQVKPVTSFEFEAVVDWPWGIGGEIPQADVFWLHRGDPQKSALFSAYGEQMLDFSFPAKTILMVEQGWDSVAKENVSGCETIYYSIDGAVGTQPPDQVALASVAENTTNFGSPAEQVAEGYKILSGTEIGCLGLADPSGKVVCDPSGLLYFPHYTDDEDVILYRDPEGMWRFIDRRGETIFPEKYDKASGFWNGYSIVVDSGKVCLLSRTGEKVLETVFSDCLAYSPHTMVCLLEYTDESGNSALGLAKMQLDTEMIPSEEPSEEFGSDGCTRHTGLYHAIDTRLIEYVGQDKMDAFVEKYGWEEDGNIVNFVTFCEIPKDEFLRLIDEYNLNEHAEASGGPGYDADVIYSGDQNLIDEFYSASP